MIGNTDLSYKCVYMYVYMCIHTHTHILATPTWLAQMGLLIFLYSRFVADIIVHLNSFPFIFSKILLYATENIYIHKYLMYSFSIGMQIIIHIAT